MAGQPVEQGLHGLETPTLLTTNADDPMWTIAAAQAAAAHLRNGALAILPGSGHVGPLLQDAPDVVAMLTAFWRNPWGSGTGRPDAAQGLQAFLDVVRDRVDAAV